jgi:hypothetical protein
VAGGAVSVEVEALLDHPNDAGGGPVQAADRTGHAGIGDALVPSDDLLVQDAERPRQVPMGDGAAPALDDVGEVGAQDGEVACLADDVAVLRRRHRLLHVRVRYAGRGRWRS